MKTNAAEEWDARMAELRASVKVRAAEVYAEAKSEAAEAKAATTEEKGPTATNTISIDLDVSNEAMEIDAREPYDATASVAAYVAMVIDQVSAAFPGYAVGIEYTDYSNKIIVSDGGPGEDLGDKAQAVQYIIEEIYEEGAFWR